LTISVDSLTTSIRDSLAAIIERFLAVANRVIQSIVGGVSAALATSVQGLTDTFDFPASSLRGAF